ncbi:MAG TPA: tRNA 4-thiouridine(8) synthase ThiI, partial [Candidatus Caccomorpha excrementavium]|nr:tRNA 4-thiouridine(8) synthase ThiI [Candidatus Caccomorpha excrementavium]
MLYKAFLIKYAEIGLKGKNRWVFENALRDQVQYNLDKIGEYRVIREQGRIFVECPKNYDYDETVEMLTRVFGVSAICPVCVIENAQWDNL